MTTEPKTLLDLKTNECKFPVEERDGQHLFCAKVRVDSSTYYCAPHQKVMYTERRPRPVTAPKVT